MASQKPISVIGSLNIDFITLTSRLPAPGETLTAKSFNTGFGGKGANQAVACARLSPPSSRNVSMIGNVGDDTFGKDYLDALKKEGIDAQGVKTLKGVRTGVANIIVEEGSGENRILFAGEANLEYSGKGKEGDDWGLVKEGEGKGEVVVFQLEIPIEVVLHNVRLASQLGKHVIMNPAPAIPLPDDVFPHISTLVLNETESIILAGEAQKDETPAKLCSCFLSKGVKDAVIITLGGDGLVFATRSGSSGNLPANKVKVVDTTAAGDTFVGGYAVRLASHTTGSPFNYQEALQFASLAASKSVQKKGAMDAIPFLHDL